MNQQGGLYIIIVDIIIQCIIMEENNLNMLEMKSNYYAQTLVQYSVAYLRRNITSKNIYIVFFIFIPMMILWGHQ